MSHQLQEVFGGSQKLCVGGPGASGALPAEELPLQGGLATRTHLPSLKSPTATLAPAVLQRQLKAQRSFLIPQPIISGPDATRDPQGGWNAPLQPSPTSAGGRTKQLSARSAKCNMQSLYLQTKSRAWREGAQVI